MSNYPERPADAHSADGYAYVVGFSNGVVKVGRTSNPAKRLADHRRDALRFGGGEFKWWASALHRNPSDSEDALKAHCKRAGDQSPGSNEYFSGIEFDGVVEFAESLDVKPTAEGVAAKEDARASQAQAALVNAVAASSGVSGGMAYVESPALADALSMIFDPAVEFSEHKRVGAAGVAEAAEDLLRVEWMNKMVSLIAQAAKNSLLLKASADGIHINPALIHNIQEQIPA